VAYPRYSEVSKELQGKIDKRIVEVHEQYPKWGYRRIATFVSNEFEVKVSGGVVRRNIPEWRERQREYRRRYRERRREKVREREKGYKRRLREKLRPHGRDLIRIYRLNEGLDDDAIVRMMLELVGEVVSKKRVGTIIRWCRKARKSGEQRYIDLLSSYLGLPSQLIREGLGIGYEIYVGRSREVYECLVALGGVATFKELQEALGWDPKYLSRCLCRIRQKGLLIGGERKFIYHVLPDFIAPWEGLTIWYLPERQREAEERARQIALEKLEPSFRSFFEHYYSAERSRKEAYKVIPLLRKVYEERSLFTIKELINMSGCGIDMNSIERALRNYMKWRKGLYGYEGLYSFDREKIEEAQLLADLTESLSEHLFGS
jgi:hypothetical protein